MLCALSLQILNCFCLALTFGFTVKADGDTTHVSKLAQNPITCNPSPIRRANLNHFPSNNGFSISDFPCI